MNDVANFPVFFLGFNYRIQNITTFPSQQTISRQPGAENRCRVKCSFFSDCHDAGAENHWRKLTFGASLSTLAWCVRPFTRGLFSNLCSLPYLLLSCALQASFSMSPQQFGPFHAFDFCPSFKKMSLTN